VWHDPMQSPSGYWIRKLPNMDVCGKSLDVGSFAGFP
jgi:hypothetical protein